MKFANLTNCKSASREFSNYVVGLQQLRGHNEHV